MTTKGSVRQKNSKRIREVPPGPVYEETPIVLSCLKTGYGSRREAERANPGLRGYRCPTCTRFHVTSSKRRWIGRREA